jgi:hypothetical protein
MIWYRNWRTGENPFSNIASDLKYTGLGEEEATAEPNKTAEPDDAVSTGSMARDSTPAAGQKRKADEPQTARAKRTKQSKNDFTVEEEAKMAVYIARRSPTVTEALFSDWEEFAKEVSFEWPS